MPEPEQYLDALKQLEAAINHFVRVARDDAEQKVYVQDWVFLAASESMAEGDENLTLINHVARPGMTTYSVRGLLHDALDFYKPRPATVYDE